MKLKMRKKTSAKRAGRIVKKLRIRKKIFGTTERPRLCIYKSLKYFSAQVVDDSQNKTIVSMTTKGLEIKNKKNTDAAKALGQAFGKKLIDQKIDKVVFDRNGFIYHGRVKAFAEAAREAGLQF